MSISALEDWVITKYHSFINLHVSKYASITPNQSRWNSNVTQTNSSWFKECINYTQTVSLGLKYVSDKLKLTQILLRQSEQKLAGWGLCLRAMKIKNENSIVGMLWYSHWFVTYHTKIWEKNCFIKMLLACSAAVKLKSFVRSETNNVDRSHIPSIVAL